MGSYAGVGSGDWEGHHSHASVSHSASVCVVKVVVVLHRMPDCYNCRKAEENNVCFYMLGEVGCTSEVMLGGACSLFGSCGGYTE